MSASTPTSPDLSSILANLARFAPPAELSKPAAYDMEATTPASIGSPPDDHKFSDVPTPSAAPKPEDLRPRPQSRSTASPKPMIDPATITTWQEGLRCVTKIASQNARFAASIRRMMEDQRKNEMRWYSERQNLKQAQTNRTQSAAQAQSILQSLSNGSSTASEQPASVFDVEVELANFDRKIYASQQDMDVAMTAELKALGVPFFGTDRQLVTSDESEAASRMAREGQPKWSPIVTETQLLELRRRMIGHLEDLYRD